jgi:OOP family OmpA-OmpF porin
MRIVGWIIVAVLSTSSLYGQTPLSTKSKKAIELYVQADNYRVRGQHSMAVTLLNQAIQKDPNFVEAYYRLGIVYFAQKHYAKAIQFFEEGLSKTKDVKKQKVFWFDLGEAYLLTGNYEKALNYLNAYLKQETQQKSSIEKAQALKKSAEFALENQAQQAAYHFKVLSDTVNQFATQYFPVLTADEQQLIFTRRLTNDPNADEDIVVSVKDREGRWQSPVSISKNINSKLNEGTSTISADGRKLIFTSCSGRDGYGSCDLYESIKIGSDWTTPKNLGPLVNSSAWESQPSLSADGRTLYFVSDRKSGYGRRDIWYSQLDDQGRWTKAVNAGTQINSQYDEISPFIHANNQTLFFASNGLPGFGGYDIFYCERDGETWSKPKNLGAPINDHKDQFSLFITANGLKGYYAQEEQQPQGGSISKIYELRIPEKQQIKQRSTYVKGVVVDDETNEKLKATIELIDLATNQVVSMVDSDSISGEYLMVLTTGSDYALYVNKMGYLFQSLHFNYEEVSDFKSINIDIRMSRAKTGSVVVLNNIFFAVDRYELIDKSVSELEKLIKFLNDNPTVAIEISGHTDNTGSGSYNIELSHKRAQSVYTYLVNHGISPKRLQPKGYGSNRPIASNDSEEGKKLNRRIEFRVINSTEK